MTVITTNESQKGVPAMLWHLYQKVVRREEISTKGNNDPTYREHKSRHFFFSHFLNVLLVVLLLLIVKEQKEKKKKEKSKKGLLGEVNEYNCCYWLQSSDSLYLVDVHFLKYIICQSEIHPKIGQILTIS